MEKTIARLYLRSMNKEVFHIPYITVSEYTTENELHRKYLGELLSVQLAFESNGVRNNSFKCVKVETIYVEQLKERIEK